MEKVLLVKPKKETLTEAYAALEKYRGIYGVGLGLLPVPHGSAAAGELEKGGVGLVVFDGALQPPDVNCLITPWGQLMVKPVVATTVENESPLREVIGKEPMQTCAGELNRTFLFNAFRNFLSPPAAKIDLRYVKSILTSVIGVVGDNTQIRLTPEAIKEAKSLPKEQVATGVVGFAGDGFLGTLNVETTRELLVEFATRMFGCGPDEVLPDMQDDLLSELANQILGVVRTELAEFGYDLRSTLLLTANGNRHLATFSSNGRYFSCPFRHESQPFNLTLCYNTYRPTVRELSSRVGTSTGIMDVRLLTSVVGAFEEVLTTYYGERPERKETHQHLAEPYLGRSLHVIQGAGASGMVTLGIDGTPADVARLAGRLMAMPVEATDLVTVNDALGELLNQISGTLARKIEAYGYTFHRIFQGSFSSAESFRYVLKCAGRFVRFPLTIGDTTFYVLCGVNTEALPTVFDAWSMLAASPDFKRKAEA